MPPRPARFSRSTKAAKPAIAEQPEQEQGECAAEHHVQHRRTCSVEVVITPSKKRKLMSTPNESDHVDAKSVMVTPTKTPRGCAISKINFLPTPPVTPTISVSEHEVEDNASSLLLTPTSDATSSSSPSIRRSPSPSPSLPPSSYNANVYAKARSLLRLSAHTEQSHEAGPSSSRLVGRTAEREQLDAFLRSHFPYLFTEAGGNDSADLPNPSASKAKVMYISGSPGTGKTALVHNMLQQFKSRTSSSQSVFAMSSLNCTTIQKPDDIWTRLAEELDLTLPDTSPKGKMRAKWTVDSFQEALKVSETGKSLVVLDEIDHLLPTTISSSSNTSTSITSHTNVLAALFKIGLDPSSNLVLIGIANALDLTQRYQSLLFGRTDDITVVEQDEPELLHFRPFQSEEMVAIVKQRLNTLHTSTTLSDTTGEADLSSSLLPLPVIAPAALELAAKKVAAVTGDLRSFLSLIRKAVEIFEIEQRKRLLDVHKPSMSSPSNARDPISPTKNILAYQNKKRKLGQVKGDEESDLLQDPLLQFDALTAPKLSPAHILKATRIVSLVSSSSANNTSRGNVTGINSTAGSLNASSSSSGTLLQNKIGELNLHQRLALTSLLILLARRISSKVPIWTMVGSDRSSATSNDAIDVDVEASSIPNGGAKPSELHALYKSILEREDLIHPVSSSEFSDLLSGLHTRGLVGFEREMFRFNSGNSTIGSGGLAPPMMRRSSSSSSITSNGASSSTGSGRTSRSPSPNTATSKNGAQAPLYLLYPFTSLHSLLSLPSSVSTSSSSSSPASTTIKHITEASSICANLLNRESKRLKRMSKMKEQLEIQRKENELAPRAGFNGNGLDEDLGNNTNGRKRYVGEKDRKGRDGDAEEQEEAEGMKNEDHEKLAKLQEEREKSADDARVDNDDSW